MTPERLTGLAALLLEVRDWLAQHDPESLDELIVEEAVNILGRIRRELVGEGAR